MLDYLSLVFVLMAILPSVAIALCILKDRREQALWVKNHYFCERCLRWKECKTHKMTKCPINW